VDGSVNLDQVATVGVRDGTTLVVTVFDKTVSDAHLPLISIEYISFLLRSWH
jgi:ribosome recycling factor